MQNVKHPYLDLARIENLRHMRLLPREFAAGTYSGAHKSQYRGSSVEFADYRNYVEGDDIRRLDWKAYARTNRHYVRMYESERNLLSYAVVDTSGSMGYKGAVIKTYSKLEYACRLVAALGYLVVREGDSFGLSLVDEKVNEHMPPGRSWPHFSQMLDTLQQAKAGGKTSLGQCLDTVYSRTKRRGVLMVFSDFLDQGEALWKAVNLFRVSHFDVVLFHCVHPEELRLPAIASGKFVDPESRTAPFKVEPELVRDLYTKRVKEFIDSIKNASKARRCEWRLVRTDEDPYVFLKRFFLSG